MEYEYGYRVTRFGKRMDYWRSTNDRRMHPNESGEAWARARVTFRKSQRPAERAELIRRQVGPIEVVPDA